MRLFGFEISRVPFHRPEVWVRTSISTLGLRVTDMSPDELRTELNWVLSQLNLGRVIYTGKNDKFHRVLSGAPHPYYNKEL